MAKSPEPRKFAAEELLPRVYDELRRVARHYLKRQPVGFTLRPTELVNEACMHLIQHGQTSWQGETHFRAIAARKIWQVVVDYLKRRAAKKRGGGGVYADGPPPVDPAQPRTPRRRMDLDVVAVEWHDRPIDVLDLAEALEELAQESSRLRDVVTLHWFGGLTYAEVAATLGVSASTAEKDFRYALAWLNRRLSGRTST